MVKVAILMSMTVVRIMLEMLVKLRLMTTIA